MATACRLLALSFSKEGKAWHVRRLDGKGGYFLVHVPGRVACIDEASGTLLSSAVAERAPVAVEREAALAIAGAGDAAPAELVWEATAATLSMFYPLWSVILEGATVFVDQRGKVWPVLPPKAPGGGPG